MKKLTIALFSLFFSFAVMISPSLVAQEADLYTEGSVWNLTFVKLKANMGDEYLKGLSKTWKASMDELVSQKLIKSYKILIGSASNPQDFDLILMTELENYASMDPNPEKEKKIEEIEKKIKEGMGDEYEKTVSSYSTLREITGRKTMREIFLN
ncbi:MAG: hypothetical protein MUC31_02585 [Bacteroidales bacterium]|jgi:hypothetical protein|nr:hypothetical protein [Bacteroidales bacterium]